MLAPTPNFEQQAYETHLNYIKCLAFLMLNASVKNTLNLNRVAIPHLNEKENLIKLTKKSLSDEKGIVQIDKDYSYASTSWLPIKSYYLIFNVLLTNEYVLKIQKNVFQTSHFACIEEYTRKLRDNEIQFSEPLLNQVFDGSILKYRVPAGSNLSCRTSDEDMYKMAMRKIAKYKEEDWKRKNKISLRKKLDKMKYESHMSSSFFVSIFDFPYYMRIRSNYRDFAFIEGVGTDDTAEYFIQYFNFTVLFVKALEKMTSEIISTRTNK